MQRLLPSSTLLRPFRCMGSTSGPWLRTSVTDRDRRGLEKRRRSHGQENG